LFEIWGGKQNYLQPRTTIIRTLFPSAQLLLSIWEMTYHCSFIQIFS